MEITWLSTLEVSQILDVSGTYVRRITPDLMRNRPDAVRKVADKRGRPRWEWSSDLVKSVKAKRKKRAYKSDLSATNTATNEATMNHILNDVILPIQPQPEPQLSATIQADLTATATNVSTTNEEEVIFELGLHSQSDGNLMQVFTPEEYDTFRSMLIKLPLIEQSHQDLKESYEAHVETYRSENAYLRKSLEAQQQITNQLAETHRKAIQGMNQRNYIEAQRLQEQNNPTIVLPKES
jgi:hypothetical protein